MPRKPNPRSIRWDERAACRGLDPQLFFPTSEEADAAAAAKKICSTCPVKGECLEEALINYEFGVWGGTTFSDRRRIRAARRLAGGREEHSVTDTANRAG